MSPPTSKSDAPAPVAAERARCLAAVLDLLATARRFKAPVAVLRLIETAATAIDATADIDGL